MPVPPQHALCAPASGPVQYAPPRGDLEGRGDSAAGKLRNLQKHLLFRMQEDAFTNTIWGFDAYKDVRWGGYERQS